MPLKVQKSDWYRKQQTQGFGHKRTFEQMTYGEYNRVQGVDQDFEGDDQIPFEIYCRRRAYTGLEREISLAKSSHPAPGGPSMFRRQPGHQSTLAFG